MKEVEILVEVLENKEKVLKKLESFNFVGIKKVMDVYFFDPLRIELKPNDKNRLAACFRLRQKDKKFFLAYKNDVFNDSGTWLYSDEYEIEISDFNKAEKIIKQLGLEVLLSIKIIKHTFETLNYEIVLEEVDNLGLFLEVEKKNVANEENIEDIKKEIWKFIKSLKIKISAELNIGKPELMLNKKNIN